MDAIPFAYWLTAGVVAILALVTILWYTNLCRCKPKV